MRTLFRSRAWPLAGLGCVAAVAALAAQGIFSEPLGVRRLSDREMAAAVGLQMGWYYQCQTVPASCYNYSPDCSNNCTQCTNTVSEGGYCMMVYFPAACTPQPSVSCGDQLQGVCVYAECDGTMICDMSAPLVNPGACGTVPQCL